MRQRRCDALWCVVMCACVCAWAGCAPSASPEHIEAPAHRLSVVSWNLNWLHQHDEQGLTPRGMHDYEALSRYAKALDADVIVLQEIDGEEAARRIFDPQEYAFHISSRDNVQRVGIVYRRHLRVVRHADVVELARVHSERLRYGVDLSVFEGERELRVLGVHLKSGCFSSPFEGPYARGEREDACRKLEAQVPVLTRWMKRRAEDRTPFMLVGDFNRRLRPGDSMWEQMKHEVPEAGLVAPTMGQRSACWGGKYPEFIDHLVMDRRASKSVGRRDFFQVVYAEEDAERHGYKLSDHCPVGLR